MARLARLLGCALFLCTTCNASDAQEYWIDKTGKRVEFRYNTDSIPGWKIISPEDPGTQMAPCGKVFAVSHTDVLHVSEDRVCIKSENKFGYADFKGDLVIPAQYVEAHGFNSGRAIVRRSMDKPYELIDHAGQTLFVIPDGLTPTHPEQGLIGNNLLEVYLVEGEYRTRVRRLYSFTQHKLLKLPKGWSLNPQDQFSEDRASLGVPLAIPTTSSERRYGYIDQDGAVVIRPVYEYAGQFHDGLAPVLKDGRYRYIDKAGDERLTLPTDCSFACEFREGLAAVAVGGDLSKPHKQGTVPRGARYEFIDTNGKVVIPPKFFVGDDIAWPTQFDNGLAAVMQGAPAHNYGYIDHSGKWVIAPVYKAACRFSHDTNSLAMVTERAKDFKKLWEDGGQPKSPPRSGWGYRRREALNIFLTQYDVFTLDRNSMQNLLGAPQGSSSSMDSFCLGSECTGASYVNFEYASGCVFRYRFSWMPDDMWFDRQHPNTGDW